MDTNPERIFELLPNLSKDDKALIVRACEFAQKAHEGQLRKSGEPYYNHVFATGVNLATLKMDADTIAAGIMHDVLEDTAVTEEEMVKEFGEHITKLVNGVTKLGKLRYSGVERHVESLRKFFVAMADDIRVVVIKLCDRLHNIQTLQYVDNEKQRRIALETIELHARLADRLGMGRLKAELEDAAFPYVYPEDYKQTVELFKSLRPISDEQLEKVSSKLGEELSVFDVHIERIDSRIKHLYSLWQKLKKYKMDQNKIYDVIALRIIVPTIAECYQALGVIHGLYKPVPGRFKDYIAVPKPNGYRSLHTTIFSGDGTTLEIQIRTKDMHQEAEYGIASHLSYKEVGKNMSEQEIKKKVGWTKDLLEWQKDVEHHQEFMKNLKTDFFEKRVFVLTPKGDVIDLPEGSTPIDFAYAVHSKIGDHIAGSKVNGKLAPLDTTLRNRDVVEIEVKESATPKRKWIDMARTTMAKRKIRQYIRENGGLLDKFLTR
ncbi:MAG: bifunctional (p)ppGpp synthetase/guanosine-3',5'-bis(diphosphate) 3'-pyrophosphohydrolase [Candidatus Pacebacteria bacterium]|nr:bifunctional (p)ppGpp synthetase/guanosine-3',5'-bis(diphosphate) 3'-pyrophosphohydrolase [Candidatus Paceibacterota bacterium]